VDGGTRDVELLLARIKQEISSLRDDPRFKEPADGKRGAGLYEHVVDLLESCEWRIERSNPGPEASSKAREAFARTLRESITVLGEAQFAIPWLIATRSPNVNLGSLYMSEELTEILVGKDADLVIVPDRKFMYSTISWPFSSTIESTPGFTRRTKRRPIIVHYPLSDSDRLLLHPLFAHEIGHSTVYKFKLVERFGSEVMSGPDFIQRLRDEAEQVMTELSPGVSQLRLRRELRENLRNWIKELLCDLLATEAVGPAFLWAVGAFGLPLNRSEPTFTHPPATLRVKLILDLLESNDWRGFCESTAPEIMALLDEVATDASNDLGRPWDFLRNEVLAQSEWLRGVVSERVGDRKLRPVVGGEANEAADLLDQLILPVGSDEDPFEPRAIMLAGWLQALRGNGDSPEGLVGAQKNRRLQDLVGKAIEMSTVLTSWERQ
jgi:hypothetical protein